MSEIQPVVTDEQWAHLPQIERVRVSESNVLFLAERKPSLAGVNTVVIDPAKEYAAAVALFNDALPQGSEHKLTHDDVDWLRSSATRIEHEFGPPQCDDEIALLRIAQKLESLLRPRA